MAEKFLMELRAMKKNAVQQRCRVMRCSGRQSMLKSRAKVRNWQHLLLQKQVIQFDNGIGAARE